MILSASSYIIACSAKNRLLVRLRRLREPRYMLGAIAGAAYLYFAVFMRIGAGRRPRRNRPPSDFSLGVGRLWPSIGGAAFLVLAALAWVSPGGSGLFEFSEAEVQFLFPAPISRRQLLLHRIARSQLGLLFAAMLPAFLITNPTLQIGSAGVRLLRGLALWVIFLTLRVYVAGVMLARARLTAGDSRVRRAAWAPLLATLTALALVGVPVVRSWMRGPVGSADEALSRFTEVVSSGLPRIVLWPFVSLVRPLFSDWPGPFLLAMAGSLAVMVVTVVWVLLSDETFQRVPDQAPPRKERSRTSSMSAPTARDIGWPLGLSGRTETLFLWKNAMQTLRGTKLMTVLPLAIPITLLAVVSATARMSPGTRGPAAAFATVSLALAAFCALLGPQAMRGDLREDLPHLEQLKTWPVKAAALIRGELLWPTTLLTLCAWLALACGTIFSTAAFPAWPLASRLSRSAAAFLLVPALIAAQLAVHNAAAVIFPAWVSTGHQRSRGLEAMGQRLILFGGVMFSLVVLVGPGAIAGAIVTFAFYRLIGDVSLVPAAVVCLAIVAIEILLVTEILGGMYDRIDLSQVERAE